VRLDNPDPARFCPLRRVIFELGGLSDVWLQQSSLSKEGRLKGNSALLAGPKEGPLRI
jgi:hypothetical protein